MRKKDTLIIIILLTICGCTKNAPSNHQNNIPLGTFEADINGVHGTFDTLLESEINFGSVGGDSFYEYQSQGACFLGYLGLTVYGKQPLSAVSFPPYAGGIQNDSNFNIMYTAAGSNATVFLSNQYTGPTKGVLTITYVGADSTIQGTFNGVVAAQ